MRILLVAPSYPPRVGGLERQLEAMRQLWQDLGHHVEVLTFRDAAAAAEPGVTVLPARFRLAGSFPVPRRPASVEEAVRAARPDVVVTNTRFFLPTWLAARAARRLGLPYIHVEHGAGHLRGRSRAVDAVAWAFDRTAGRSVLRHAAVVVGVSAQAAAFAQRLGGRPATAIPNWVRFTEGPAVARRLDALRAHGFPRAPRLLFVGRLVANKGVADLAEGAALAAAQRPGLRLRFVGEGPERRALAARPRPATLAVEAPGAVSGEPALRREYAAADLAMNPSHGEGFGLALLEAVAAGVPVIASDCPAHVALLDGGRRGALHAVGDPASIASALVAALSDPAGCADRAERAHRELRRVHDGRQARLSWQAALDEAVPRSKPK